MDNHTATLTEELNAHQKNRANINEFLFYSIFTIGNNFVNVGEKIEKKIYQGIILTLKYQIK